MLNQIRKVQKVRQKKKKKKKGPHLFWAEKLGKLSQIRKVHPENQESWAKLGKSSGKLGKLSQIRKAHPGNSESQAKLGKFQR